MGWMFVAAGAVLGVVSLFASSLGLASSSAFGWKKVAGTLGGAALCGLGGALLGWLTSAQKEGRRRHALLAAHDDAAAPPAGRRVLGALESLPLRIASMATVAVGAAYLAVALRPNVLVDDAAISFRYVQRLSDGLGFTYNNHEHVLGASNPLYVLVLTAIHLAGPGIETSARALAGVLVVASILLAMDVARRLSNTVGAVLAGLLLAADWFFRYQALSGLESGLSVVLGLLAVSALIRDREILAGLFLGLAIWNKLDAGLLAVAVALAYLAVKQRFPVRVAIVATAVALPWLVFAKLYFGSPVPQSFRTKLAQGGSTPFDHWWVTRFFASELRPIVLLLAFGFLVVVWRARKRESAAAIAALTLAGWFLLHAGFFSVVSLGANYPWYLTVLVPPGVILAAAFIGRAAKLSIRLQAQLALLAAGILLLALPFRAQWLSTSRTLSADNPITPFEAFDNDRRLAGAWLARYASPHEPVASYFGWVAFEVPNPFDDYTRLNSRRMLAAAYYVTSGADYRSAASPPIAPPGFKPLATFNLAADLAGWSWFTVFGRPSATITRSRERYLQYRLPQLVSDSSPELGGGSIQGLDLVTPRPSRTTITVPCERLPLHVVFTPFVPGGRQSAVSYRIWFGRTLITTVRSRGGGAAAPVIVSVPGSTRFASARLVLQSSWSGPGLPSGPRWADIKFVVGDAYVPPGAARSARMMRAWLRYNPAASGLRQPG